MREWVEIPPLILFVQAYQNIMRIKYFDCNNNCLYSQYFIGINFVTRILVLTVSCNLIFKTILPIFSKNLNKKIINGIITIY